jgi:hypothetical protein
MKTLKNISEAQRSYERKQAERQETTLVPHSQKYHDRVKAEKTPPPPSKQTYGQNEYD